MPYKDPEKRREAQRKADRKRYAANPEDARERVRKHHAANPEAHCESSRKWRAANPEKARETKRRWWAGLSDEARARSSEVTREAARRRYAENNETARASGRAARARRRAAELRATPPWQSREELDAILRASPEGYHCDHIHPLKGKLSCGLNVPWNLNYLAAEENHSKTNRQPQPGYFDWFSEPWTIHATPTGRVWTPPNPEYE